MRDANIGVIMVPYLMPIFLAIFPKKNVNLHSRNDALPFQRTSKLMQSFRV